MLVLKFEKSREKKVNSQKKKVNITLPLSLVRRHLNKNSIFIRKQKIPFTSYFVLITALVATIFSLFDVTQIFFIVPSSHHNKFTIFTFCVLLFVKNFSI